jgi:hypothetical protein
MTSMLIPLAFNELLDRPLIGPFNSALAILSFITRCSTLFLREACLTLELTGRGRKAFNLIARKNDESDAIPRSG